MQKSNQKQKKIKPVSVIVNLFMVLIATISILPFILMFVMSTQDNQMIFSGITFRIGTALKDNFRTILEADYFRSVINSLIVAVSSTVLTVIFSAMAGFAFAKYEFRNKKILFQVVLMTMMVPMEVGLVAFAWEMRILHLSKTFLPLILPNIANAFGVFWMTQYMKDAFPYELIESGKIDGCNDMGVFIRLVLPIIRPAVFTLSIISFLQSWNSYLLPMIMIIILKCIRYLWLLHPSGICSLQTTAPECWVLSLGSFQSYLFSLSFHGRLPKVLLPAL